MSKRRVRNSTLLATIASHPPVEETDNDLILRCKNGDSDASFLLFVKHHRMVLQVILRITSGCWFSDDILQAGATGMYEAVKRFDPDKGYTFLTFAVPWVFKYVMLEMQNETLPMVGLQIGRDKKAKLYKFVGLKMTGATPEETMAALKISRVVYNSLDKMSQISAAELNSGSSDSDDDRSVDAALTTPGIESDYIKNESVKDIEDLVNSIDSKTSVYIISHILGINGCEACSNKEIAGLMGIKMKDFHPLRRRAIYKLKVALRDSNVKINYGGEDDDGPCLCH